MTPTTNKLVRLDDVLNILWSDFAAKKIKLLPTYPEPTKGSNYALLQSKLDNWARTIEWKDSEVREFIKEIQSKLIEPMEYEIGKEYEFSIDGKKWNQQKFVGYHTQDSYMQHCRWNHIRPITPISPEISSAISLLEATGEYVITKR